MVQWFALMSHNKKIVVIIQFWKANIFKTGTSTFRGPSGLCSQYFNLQNISFIAVGLKGWPNEFHLAINLNIFSAVCTFQYEKNPLTLSIKQTSASLIWRSNIRVDLWGNIFSCFFSDNKLVTSCSVPRSHCTRVDTRIKFWVKSRIRHRPVVYFWPKVWFLVSRVAGTHHLLVSSSEEEATFDWRRRDFFTGEEILGVYTRKGWRCEVKVTGKTPTNSPQLIQNVIHVLKTSERRSISEPESCG